MSKKGDKMGLHKTFALHRRAVHDMNRVVPGCFRPFIYSALAEALFPYVIIWLSARLIDELASLRRIDQLEKWVIFILLTTAITELIKAVLQRWKSAREEVYSKQYEILYTEKFLQMDYADCDDQRVRDRFIQIQQTTNWGGWGFPYLTKYFSQAVEGLAGILGALTLTLSLFTRKVPASAGGLVFLNHPIFIVAIFLLIGGITYLGPVLGDKANTVWSELADESRFGNRVFSHFSTVNPGKKEKDMDRRIYRQGELSDHYLQRVNIFGVGSHFDRLMQTRVGLSLGLSAGLSAILSATVYALVGLKALAGAFGVGSVTQYVSAVTAFSTKASLLFDTVNHMRTNATFLETIYDFLDIPQTLSKGKERLKKDGGDLYELEFRDVSFRYPGSDIWALRHVNLHIKWGRRLALVGENGSGKTTFIKLLCRLYDPQEGRIFLNGTDIRDYRYADYMALFSVVFQDYQLLNQPLGNNVAGAMTYDRKRARKTLVDAGFGHRLSEMEKGLDTMLYRELSEEGTDLSGGEAQKVAIARALYKEAPILILDEPTAALDPIAEAEIYSKFNEIAGDKTSIFISHRLSSCKFCDEIAVFHEGRVIQYGNHRQLLADKKGQYYRLWTAQAQYYAKASPDLSLSDPL